MAKLDERLLIAIQEERRKFLEFIDDAWEDYGPKNTDFALETSNVTVLQAYQRLMNPPPSNSLSDLKS